MARSFLDKLPLRGSYAFYMTYWCPKEYPLPLCKGFGE